MLLGTTVTQACMKVSENTYTSVMAHSGKVKLRFLPVSITVGFHKAELIRFLNKCDEFEKKLTDHPSRQRAALLPY